MKKADYIYPIFSAFLIFCMSIFISCASQQATEEDPFADGGSDEVVAEESVEEGSDGSEEAGEEVAEASEDNMSLEKEADEGMAELEADLANLDEEAPAAEQEDLEAAAETFGEDDAALEKELEGEEVASAEGQEAGEEELGEELGEELDEELGEELGEEVASNEEVSENNEELEEMFGEEEMTNQEVAANETTQSFEASAPKKVVRSVTPSIPQETKTHDGTLLNRFYFTRAGDSPEKVSQLLYGSSSQADFLSAANGARRLSRPGSLIYYSSPTAPNDQVMRSYYQEQGVTPEDYTIGQGDWLSLVAERQYGDIRSWKEIAALNGISDPDRLEMGQRISLYPADLSGYAAGSSVDTQPQVAQLDPQPEPVLAPEPVEPEVAEPVDLPPAQPIRQPRRPKKPVADQGFGGLNVKKVLGPGQNLLFYLIGGIILVLLTVLVVLRRRKKAAEADFQDDAFAASPRRRSKG